MYPADLRYDEEHEWVKVDGDVATIGISDFAQEQLGEVVYVDLPSVGDPVTRGESFGEIESVKSVSELFAPVSGEVVEVNPELQDTPEVINQDSYGTGWMIKVKVDNLSEVDALMDADSYEAYLAEEA